MEDGVGQCRRAAQHSGERDAGQVRIDVERLTLIAEAIARDAEPFELEPARQLERRARQLTHRVSVIALALITLGGEAREAREVVDEIGDRGDPSLAEPGDRSRSDRVEVLTCGDELGDAREGRLDHGLRGRAVGGREGFDEVALAADKDAAQV